MEKNAISCAKTPVFKVVLHRSKFVRYLVQKSRILKISEQFANTLRTLSGPDFRFPEVRKRGRGKNPRPPRNEFGPKSTLPANFSGARYQQKAVGSNANLRPSGAREIIMVTKERPGGVVGEKKEGLGKGPATALWKSPLSQRSTGDNKKRKK